MCHKHYSHFIENQLLNQVCAGCRPARTWFLEITSVQMYVCVCPPPSHSIKVCNSPPATFLVLNYLCGDIELLSRDTMLCSFSTSLAPCSCKITHLVMPICGGLDKEGLTVYSYTQYLLCNVRGWLISYNFEAIISFLGILSEIVQRHSVKIGHFVHFVKQL